MYRSRCLLLMLWYVLLYPRFSMAQNDSMPFVFAQGSFPDPAQMSAEAYQAGKRLPGSRFPWAG